MQRCAGRSWVLNRVLTYAKSRMWSCDRSIYISWRHEYGTLAWSSEGFSNGLRSRRTQWCLIQGEDKRRHLFVYLSHSRKKKKRITWKMNTFPLFKQNKSYQSSILTLIIIWITSAIIPTITTIINKTTNTEHPPHNIGGQEAMAYQRGMASFKRNIK